MSGLQAAGAALLSDLVGNHKRATSCQERGRKGDILGEVPRGYTQRPPSVQACMTGNLVTHLQNCFRFPEELRQLSRSEVSPCGTCYVLVLFSLLNDKVKRGWLL